MTKRSVTPLIKRPILLIPLPERLRGTEGACRFAGNYIFRYWILSSLPALIGTLGADALPIGVYVFILHGLVGLLLFPGSALMTWTIVRLCPSRARCDEPWRPWVAGALTIALLWLGPLLVICAHIEPPSFLIHHFGIEWAWILHLASVILAASTLSQAIVWCFPPRPWRTLRP